MENLAGESEENRIEDKVGEILGSLPDTDRNALEEYHRKLLRDAREDPLTKINNKRGLEDEVGQIVELIKDGDVEQVVVVILDIDSFKQINDGLGHKFGDDLLCMVASWLRESDVIGSRYGGDEFVMVLPVMTGKKGFSEESLRIKLDEFRQGLEDRRLRMEDSLEEGVIWPRSKSGDGPAGRVSFGGSVFEAEEFLKIVNSGKDALDGLLDKADAKLYEKKKQG